MSIVVKNISKKFGNKEILKDISFTLNDNECLALIGRSGIGKSTLGDIISGITNVDSGEIFYDGKLKSKYSEIDFAKKIGKVFQNPGDSLNPKMRIKDILDEPYVIDCSRSISMDNIYSKLKINKNWFNRYPHELSGGEKQRVALARALSVEPHSLVCDEITSALDLVNSFEIIEFLTSIKNKTSILFISHDLAMIKKIADRVLILDNVKIDILDKESFFKSFE